VTKIVTLKDYFYIFKSDKRHWNCQIYCR